MFRRHPKFPPPDTLTWSFSPACAKKKTRRLWGPHALCVPTTALPPKPSNTRNSPLVGGGGGTRSGPSPARATNPRPRSTLSGGVSPDPQHMVVCTRAACPIICPRCLETGPPHPFLQGPGINYPVPFSCDVWVGYLAWQAGRCSILPRSLKGLTLSILL